MIAALDDPRANVRAAAAQALASFELTAESVSSLAKALGNPDGYVRAFAAWCLGNLGPAAREAVPALVEALGPDDTANVVAAALARIGPAAGGRWRAARTLG